MKETYTYDELYGTLLYKNNDNTERTYFVIDCETYKFYKWMFQYGWNKVSEKYCERNGLIGFEITIKTIPVM